MRWPRWNARERLSQDARSARILTALAVCFGCNSSASEVVGTTTDKDPRGDAGGGPMRDSASSAANDAENRTEACLIYGIAQLSRVDECNGRAPMAPREIAAFRLDDCPDLFFSEGADRSVEHLLECAEAWREFACDDIRRGLAPDCVRYGSLQPGEACLFSSQCASGFCAFTADQGCSVCVTRVGPGERCDDAERLCEPGYRCEESCVEIVLSQPSPGTKPTGAECEDTEECSGDDQCLLDAEANRRCTARVPVGASCMFPSEACGTDAYCDETIRCRLLPRDGEACGVDRVRRRVCGVGFFCDETDPEAPLCQSNPAPEDACQDGGRACPEGSLCCFDPSCPERTCFQLGLPGEPCAASPTECHPGAECIDGQCEPILLRGLFEEACGSR